MSALLLLFPLSSAIMLPPAGGDHRTLSGTRGRVSAFAGPAWPAPAVKWCFRCARPRPGEKAALRMRGGGDQDHQGGATVQQPSAGQARRMPWGVIYGIGFGAITASRIAHEAHLQAFYLNIIPPNLVGAGWTLFCAAVALAEPTIGVMLDKLRAAGIRQTTDLRTCTASFARAARLCPEQALMPLLAAAFEPLLTITVLSSAPAVAGERVLDLGALHEQSSSAVGAGTHLRGSPSHSESQPALHLPVPLPNAGRPCQSPCAAASHDHIRSSSRHDPARHPEVRRLSRPVPPPPSATATS